MCLRRWRSPHEQGLTRLVVTFACRHLKRGLALAILSARVGAVVQQEIAKLRVPSASSNDERGVVRAVKLRRDAPERLSTRLAPLTRSARGWLSGQVLGPQRGFPREEILASKVIVFFKCFSCTRRRLLRRTLFKQEPLDEDAGRTKSHSGERCRHLLLTSGLNDDLKLFLQADIADDLLLLINNTPGLSNGLSALVLGVVEHRVVPLAVDERIAGAVREAHRSGRGLRGPCDRREIGTRPQQHPSHLHASDLRGEHERRSS
mmetsp:Transcript_21517/g.64610  ORF Transcript_21517/g.64610 Transcript_21517/m.64610 type:complete len:262 (+) Transcript_21517:187-972(+)